MLVFHMCGEGNNLDTLIVTDEDNRIDGDRLARLCGLLNQLSAGFSSSLGSREEERIEAASQNAMRSSRTAT